MGFSVTDDSTNEVTKIAEIPYTAGDGIEITNKEVSVGDEISRTWTGTVEEWNAIVDKSPYDGWIINLTNDPAMAGQPVIDIVQENNFNAVTSNAVAENLVKYVDIENVTTAADGAFGFSASDIGGDIISVISFGTHLIIPSAFGGGTYYFVSLDFSNITKEVSTNIGTVRVWYKPFVS